MRSDHRHACHRDKSHGHTGCWRQKYCRQEWHQPCRGSDSHVLKHTRFQKRGRHAGIWRAQVVAWEVCVHTFLTGMLTKVSGSCAGCWGSTLSLISCENCEAACTSSCRELQRSHTYVVGKKRAWNWHTAWAEVLPICFKILILAQQDNGFLC